MSTLTDISTLAPGEYNKREIKERTEGLLEELDELQNLLYASKTHAVLVILQGMDASGKDGVIRKVLGRANPQGVQVHSFKVPTEEEKSHDFLWRLHCRTPAKGTIGVFNRSHYEDVLVTRVHGWCDDATAQSRFAAINHFEQLLAEHNATVILKFYLHISREEQQQRLQERLQDPRKHWKYDAKDFDESALWDRYMPLYEEVFAQCSAVPWVIVPADQNWYKEYVVAKTVVDALKALHLAYPALKTTG